MSATPDGRRSAGTAADRSEAPRTLQRQQVLGVLIRVLIVAGLVTGFAYNLVGLPGLRDFGFYYRLDLDVYRLGGSVFLHGPTLYGSMPPTQMGNFLPFTYPPLAAVVFSPLSLVSLEAAGVVVTVLSLVALFGALLVTLDSSESPRGPPWCGRRSAGWPWPWHSNRCRPLSTTGRSTSC